MPESEILTKAETKIKEEYTKFKEEVLKLEPEKQYYMSGVITFTAATVHHLEQLISSENLCKLILNEDAKLKDAVHYIITRVTKKYGMSGDLPPEEFHQLIWDYYRIDHTAAKKALEEREKQQKKRLETSKNKLASKAHNKKNNQLNILDLMKNSDKTKSEDANVTTTITDKKEVVTIQNSPVVIAKSKSKTKSKSNEHSSNGEVLQISLF